MQNLIDLIAQDIQRNSPDRFEEFTQPADSQIKIISMEEEFTIINLLNHTAAKYDIDILEYSLHYRMTEDEDGNFISTYTFTFLDLKN